MNNFSVKLRDYMFCTLTTFLVSFFVFVSLFHTPLFKSVKVLMYRGIVLLIIAAIINIVLGILLKKFVFKNLDACDLFSIMVLFCSITIVFFVLVPVTVERSVSVYMLSEMEESGKEFSKEEVEEKFVKTYVKEFGAFEKRFEEQILTGTIDKVENDRYIINDKGRFIVNMFRFVAKLFNSDDKLVYPNSKGK